MSSGNSEPLNEPRIWMICQVCGASFSVDVELAAFLRQQEAEECPVCAPSLHGRYG